MCANSVPRERITRRGNGQHGDSERAAVDGARAGPMLHHIENARENADQNAMSIVGADVVDVVVMVMIVIIGMTTMMVGGSRRRSRSGRFSYAHIKDGDLRGVRGCTSTRLWRRGRAPNPARLSIDATMGRRRNYAAKDANMMLRLELGTGPDYSSACDFSAMAYFSIC
jgi:hypothetical protein